jgi:hypothetical protein
MSRENSAGRMAAHVHELSSRRLAGGKLLLKVDHVHPGLHGRFPHPAVERQQVSCVA